MPALLLLWGVVWVYAQDNYLPNRVLFALRPPYTLYSLPKELQEISQWVQGTPKLRFPTLKMDTPIYALEYEAPYLPMYVAKLFRRSEGVLFAEPEYIPQALYTPNDPSISPATTPFLYGSQVLQAWDTHKGDTNTVIGVVDTDLRWDHPDLIGNIKFNWADPINGIDDDNDGYVDNFQGWDLVGATYSGSGPFSPDNDPRLPSGGGHGTWIGGYAGATPDNNLGAAGTGFKCKLMGVKAAPDNAGALYAAYDGLMYAAQKGAKVINASWGGTVYSAAAETFIRNLVQNTDALIVAAAGNIPPPLDTRFYPAMYPDVMSITAVKPDSTWTGGTQAYYGISSSVCGAGVTTAGASGFSNLGYTTSFSAGVASGCAAIVRSYFPSLNAHQVRERIRITGDRLEPKLPDSLDYKLGTRINLHRALTAPDTPACRIVTFQVSDRDDELYFVGDTLHLWATYKNFLAPVTNLSVSIQSLSPHVDIVQGSYGVGDLATLAQNNQPLTQAFRIKLLPGLPLDAKVSILFLYSGDNYQDWEVKEIRGINPGYIHLDAARLKTTLSSLGRIGYHDPFNNTQGIGVRWEANPSWLFEAGLAIAQASTGKTLLCTRNNSSSVYADFIPLMVPERSFASPFQKARVSFEDASAPQPLSLRIELEGTAPAAPPLNEYVILRYKLVNQSATDLTDLYVGLWADWDMSPNPTQDRGNADPARRLLYARNAANNAYVGLVLLSDFPGTDTTLYTGFTNLFPGQRTDYVNVLQSGMSQMSRNGDIFQCIGVGPLTIGALDSVEVAFAIVGSTDLVGLQENTDVVQSYFRCGTASLSVEAGQDTSLCLGSLWQAQASGGSPPYEFYWSDGNTGQSFVPSQSGIYGIWLRDAQGCLAYDEANLQIHKLPPPRVSFSPGLVVGQGEPFSAQDTQSATLDWTWVIVGVDTIRGNPLSFTFSNAGTYTLYLIRSDTACGDTLTWTLTVTASTGLEEKPSFFVTPNPCRDIVRVHYKGLPIWGRIYDSRGMLYWQGEIKNSTSISIAEWPAGMYLLQAGGNTCRFVRIP
ncbi:MAG: S8 family peptidase [Bacteroidia bacterium]